MLTTFSKAQFSTLFLILIEILMGSIKFIWDLFTFLSIEGHNIGKCILKSVQILCILYFKIYAHRNNLINYCCYLILQDFPQIIYCCCLKNNGLGNIKYLFHLKTLMRQEKGEVLNKGLHNIWVGRDYFKFILFIPNFYFFSKFFSRICLWWTKFNLCITDQGKN